MPCGGGGSGNLIVVHAALTRAPRALTRPVQLLTMTNGLPSSWDVLVLASLAVLATATAASGTEVFPLPRARPHARADLPHGC